MNNSNDYPALFRSADQLSADSQLYFLTAIGLNVIALTVAALLSFANIPDRAVASIQLMVLLVALGCSIYLYAKRPDKIWYGARAVAESVKTLAWRFACRAEPFDMEDAEASGLFHRKLRAVVEQNREVCGSLTAHLSEQQITLRMSNIRSLELAQRKKHYIELRVSDQLAWYAKKANDNQLWAKRWSAVLIALNILAILCAILRIVFIEFAYWPTDILITAAAGTLTWLQTKRYSELASSYALAAHEISFVKTQADAPETENAFSLFVGDAENAFSREHTQWVARKDV